MEMTKFMRAARYGLETSEGQEEFADKYKESFESTKSALTDELWVEVGHSMKDMIKR